MGGVRNPDGHAAVYSTAANRSHQLKLPAQQARVLKHLVKQVFGGSAASLVLNLVETGELSTSDLDAIRKKVKRP